MYYLELVCHWATYFVAIALHYIKPHVNYYYYLENQYPFFTLKSSVKDSLSVLVLVLVNCLSINVRNVRKPRVPTRDHPCIHAKRNIIITLHIIHDLQSLLHPYAMGHCQPLHFHGLWNIRAILAV